MKKVVLFILAGICCVFWGCQTSYYTKNAVAVSCDTETITLRCSGVGTTKVKAIENAELYAIETILFRGVPNTQQKVPLVNIDEKTAKSQNAKYFSELLDEERYKTFILSSVTTSELSHKKGNKKTITVDVKVNVRALRTDLERADVIRKFGF